MSECSRRIIAAVVSAMLALGTAWVTQAEDTQPSSTQLLKISERGLTPLRMEAAIDRILFSGTADADVPERLRQYEGTFVASYAQFTYEEFIVSARGDKLYLDVPSQLVFELIEPVQGDQWAFAIAPDRIQTEFVRDEQGRVTSLRMHQSGKTHEVPRKTDSTSGPASAANKQSIDE